MIDNSARLFDHPFLELFIWSILCNRSSLREYFWAKSGSPLASALFAATFYGTLVWMYNLSDTREIRILKHEYLKKASDIIELAYAKDLNKSLSLAEKKIERFGNRSLIKMSYIGNLKSFIATQPCQRVIRNTWKKGFWKITFSVD